MLAFIKYISHFFLPHSVIDAADRNLRKKKDVKKVPNFEMVYFHNYIQYQDVANIFFQDTSDEPIDKKKKKIKKYFMIYTILSF